MKKKVLGVLAVAVLFPLIAGALAELLYALVFGNYFNLPDEITYLVLAPGVNLLCYILFRKKLDHFLSVKVNLVLCAIYSILALILMIVMKGRADAVVSGVFGSLAIQFTLAIVMASLTGKYFEAIAMVILTYLVGAIFSALCLLKKSKKQIITVGLVGVVVLGAFAGDAYFYNHRDEVRYSGHGFQYMNGYSSTDFTDYTVYAKNSKLVELDHTASFTIENEADMPVLDGAEACYPVYAALAKAVYKNIDQIELDYSKSEKDDSVGNAERNGKIVAFSNTIHAFYRLVDSVNPDLDIAYPVDIFFGAKPSTDQLEYAANYGVEIEVTPIGREGFVFFVEADNPVDNLTSEEVKAIYHGDITNWSQVGGKDEEIVAFQRPANSGSQTMMEYFMGDVSLKEPKTYETVDSMVGVISNVAQYANERGAMGYTFRYFLEGLNQEKDVKLLSIDGVAPTVENIKNGSYPLAVKLVAVTRKDDPNPNVKKMIDFILSEEGQYIIEETGYAPLN